MFNGGANGSSFSNIPGQHHRRKGASTNSCVAFIMTKAAPTAGSSYEIIISDRAVESTMIFRLKGTKAKATVTLWSASYRKTEIS